MRVVGDNVKVTRDGTGGMVSVDWTCPYCGGWNAGFYFSDKLADILGPFEIDHKCENCGKIVTIECIGEEKLF